MLGTEPVTKLNLPKKYLLSTYDSLYCYGLNKGLII